MPCRGPRPGRGEGLRRGLRREVPRATAKITDDLDELLAFYDCPCEHWVHLRTTKPDRVDFRDRPAPDQGHQGAGLAAAGLGMAFKLIESAQDRWRAVNAPHLVALVRAGATFSNGQLVERPGENDQQEAA